MLFDELEEEKKKYHREKKKSKRAIFFDEMDERKKERNYIQTEAEKESNLPFKEIGIENNNNL